MKVYANRPMEVYEESGVEVRIHWNIESNISEETPDGVIADEALCLINDTKETLITKLEAEGCPNAEELADGWINVITKAY